MSTATEKLAHLRVDEVMARDVVTVRADCTMTEAAQLLRDYEVTGVPVVDDFGRCVGVLSASDYVDSKSEESPDHRPIAHVDTTWDRSGLQRANVLNKELVRANMSPKVHSIREHLSVVEAGQLMCQEHIHRLIVIDHHGKPVGIISSLDLVSALVHAAETCP